MSAPTTEPAARSRARSCSPPPEKIVQIEARHAATVAVIIAESITPSGAFDKPLTKRQALAKAGPLIKR